MVVVANDATVKAGSWWPETIRKMLRAQEIAMRQRIPIIYLVDSAGVNLPYQGGVFPGQYGAARIFYYNSIMRRYLHVPQISAVMGSCVAGGAYLPALSDVIFMVEGTSFMGLGGPNLVKGATGQTIDAETLGGARTHTEISAVAHYRAANDAECLRRIREYVGRLPRVRRRAAPPARAPRRRPVRPTDLYDLLPARSPACRTTCGTCSPASSTAGALDEFQPDLAREMICGHAHIEGWPVAVIANQRGLVKGRAGERPRFGGIVYTESAEKVAYFIETASRERLPILFVQDVSGFMVGPEAEQSGIIRAGARFVEAMATAVVPKIVLTVNHASGAGYYAMAGQGFDPDFILSWPTGRMGVMEGESAVDGGARRPRSSGRSRSGATSRPRSRPRSRRCAPTTSTSSTPATPPRAGYVDAIITPEETRDQLAFAAARRAPTTPGRTSARSCSRRSTRHPPTRADATSHLVVLRRCCPRAAARPAPDASSPTPAARQRRGRPPIPSEPRRSHPARRHRSHGAAARPRRRLRRRLGRRLAPPAGATLTAGCRSRAPAWTASSARTPTTTAAAS